MSDHGLGLKDSFCALQPNCIINFFSILNTLYAYVEKFDDTNEKFVDGDACVYSLHTRIS